MKSLRLRQFDPANYIHDAEDEAEYLTLALEDHDPAEIADALGVVARAHGMTEVAKKSGLGRESLYKALSHTGNPELATIMKVIAALDLDLVAVPRRKAQAAAKPTPKRAVA